jgi:hypothetical protein
MKWSHLIVLIVFVGVILLGVRMVAPVEAAVGEEAAVSKISPDLGRGYRIPLTEDVQLIQGVSPKGIGDMFRLRKGNVLQIWGPKESSQRGVYSDDTGPLAIFAFENGVLYGEQILLFRYQMGTQHVWFEQGSPVHITSEFKPFVSFGRSTRKEIVGGVLDLAPSPPEKWLSMTDSQTNAFTIRTQGTYKKGKRYKGVFMDIKPYGLLRGVLCSKYDKGVLLESKETIYITRPHGVSDKNGKVRWVGYKNK